MFSSRFGKLGLGAFAAVVGVILIVTTAGAHQGHVAFRVNLGSVHTHTSKASGARVGDDAATDADKIEADTAAQEAAEKAAEAQKKAAELAAEQAAEAQEDANDTDANEQDNDTTGEQVGDQHGHDSGSGSSHDD